jgi:mRNA interferase RelE/StbE
LRADPFAADTKQLEGHEALYRADIGEYRIVYTITATSVYILLVGKRNDSAVYKRLKRMMR